jgi:hypothetical protein
MDAAGLVKELVSGDYLTSDEKKNLKKLFWVIRILETKKEAAMLLFCDLKENWTPALSKHLDRKMKNQWYSWLW